MAELLFKSPSFHLIMAPKHKSSDAGNSDMTKQSYKVLLLSKKVKVLNKERKKSYAKVAKTYSNKSSFGFVFLATLRHMEFLSQGSDQSHLC